MQSGTLSIFCSLALASAMAVAQSPTPAPAQTNPPDQQSNQQVGIAAQAAPDNSAAAQTQRRPVSPQRQAQVLARQLGLSREQLAQIMPIFVDRQQRIDALRADQTVTPRDRRDRVKGVMQDSLSRIEAVMTDAQKQQYEQLLADRRARHLQQEQRPAPPQTPPQPQ
jgi:periplasmic protein CpxP/Spy